MKLKRLQSATIFILVFAIITNIFGQSLPSTATHRGMSSSAASLDGNTFSFQNAAQQPQAVLPRDNSIDPNEYIIGSGDVFFITAVETPNVRYTAAVDQTGRAFVPNIGLIEIGKISYTDAKKIIADHISSKMRNPSEIYVTIIHTKEATVSFTGAVSSPGSHILPGTTRLLDAIRMANGGNELPQSSEADLRRIKCTSRDSTVYYDLFAYLYKGDKSQNPYIYPGDRIHIYPTTNKVFVSGAVKTPKAGFYPIKKDETLKGFLSMFTLESTADTDNIIVHQPNRKNVETVSLTATYYALNDLDVITIPFKKNQTGIDTVSISGEIASPGSYPMIKNITSARQLIEKAGGTTENANMEQAVVLRTSKNIPHILNAEASRQMGQVRPERGASVAMASSTTDHTIIRLINYNADKVILEPGDKIVIPKKDRFVYISGSVRSPGAYPFVRGKSVSYYVQQAGGYSKNSDKTNIQIYLKYGDAVHPVEPRCVEPGSIIVVPASVQYKFLSQVALPLVSAVATTVGVALTIFAMTK